MDESFGMRTSIEFVWWPAAHLFDLDKIVGKFHSPDPNRVVPGPPESLRNVKQQSIICAIE